MIRKVGNWVPYELKPRNVERCLFTFKQLFQRQKRKGFLHRILTSYERRVHYDNTKRGQRMDNLAVPHHRRPSRIWWDHLGVHIFNYDEVKQWTDEWITVEYPAIFRDGIRELSERWDIEIQKQGVSVVFLDNKGIVHHEYLPAGQTVIKEMYLSILRCLREAIRKKRPEKWTNGDWILHHDNARPHTAHLVTSFLAKNGTQILPQPPYSPDIAPNVFFLFPKLKAVLKVRHFDTRNDIIEKSLLALKSIPKEAYKNCFDKWEKRWRCEAAVHASYVLSEMIAKHSKPFTEGDFIKGCLIKAAEIFCPGSVKTFQAISLSRNTVVERVTDMARNLNDQIKEKASCFEAFSIACDETTDGAPSMTGKTNGFVALLRKKLIEISDGSNIHHTHCIIHQEVLCTKVIQMENVLTPIKKFINFIRSRGLNQRQFSLFLTELESEYSGLSYYTEVRWLSCSKVLKQFWDLKEEICQFLITKNQDITFFSDQVWLQYFSSMVDITKHLSDLNLKLQEKDQIITNMCDQANAFKCKLVLWEKQLKNEDLMHFPTCNMYKSSLGETASYQKYAENILSLRNEFETRFSDFKSLEGKFTLFSSIFSINIESVPNHMQMEVIDIQCDSDLKAKFI
ncbi:hypothetical protein LAZ67_5002499 [Cordylochernes scorpioides]|uniref:Transposase n=1 Tax=Cordylochernes scorpioides TaxID=51811 RepID=A0ABY6KJH5_9ARAC|nr:hypothetical protein LAZ67_5002499 [Cordylochernes scorpioides]